LAAGLSDVDISALLGAAEFVAGADSLDALRHRTVAILPTLVPTTQAAWNEVDMDGNRIDAVMAPDIDALGMRSQFDEMSEAFMRHVGEHPCITYQMRTADGRPVAISDFLEPHAFHSTALYQHFYRHLGVEDQLSFVIPDTQRLVGITLNRAHRGISTRDRRICNLLRPYLLQAYKTVEAVSRARYVLAALDNIATDRREEIVLLDARGRTEHVSPGAHDLLQRFLGTGDVATLIRRFIGAQDSVRDGTSMWPLTCRRDGRLLVARRVAVEAGHGLLLTEQGAGSDGTDLSRLGLTVREAEVMQMVGDGRATKEIAVSLGISPRTVDKHVGRSLDKLGVRSRIAALKLMSQLAVAQPSGGPTSGGRGQTPGSLGI
jgi:DNA-binding CsgD family transcriptional regulator